MGQSKREKGRGRKKQNKQKIYFWICRRASACAYVHMCTMPAEAKRGIRCLWRWSYRFLWRCRCWEQNLGPLQEQCTFSTAKPCTWSSSVPLDSLTGQWALGILKCTSPTLKCWSYGCPPLWPSLHGYWDGAQVMFVTSIEPLFQPCMCLHIQVCRLPESLWTPMWALYEGLWQRLHGKYIPSAGRTIRNAFSSALSFYPCCCSATETANKRWIMGLGYPSESLFISQACA